jgi:hypothetical protein
MIMPQPHSASEFPHNRFWAVLEGRHPEERGRRAMRMAFFWQRGLPELQLVITMYVSPDKNRCGVFLGRNERLGATDVAARMAPHACRLNEVLGLDPSVSSAEFPFVSRWQVNCFAEDNWPAMADWLVTEASRFERTLRTTLAAQPAAESEDHP